MPLLNLIGHISYFFMMKSAILILLFVFFVSYLLFYFLVINKNKEFKNSLNRKFKLLWLSLVVYVVCVAISYLVGGFSFFPFDSILINEIGCLIIFIVILIFDKILTFSKNKILFLIESIIAFWGIWVSYILLWGITFRLIHYNGQHPPIELLFVNLIFLLISTISILVKNFYRKYWSVK